jgi:hypothetical protein
LWLLKPPRRSLFWDLSFIVALIDLRDALFQDLLPLAGESVPVPLRFLAFLIQT